MENEKKSNGSSNNKMRSVTVPVKRGEFSPLQFPWIRKRRTRKGWQREREREKKKTVDRPRASTGENRLEFVSCPIFDLTEAKTS